MTEPATLPEQEHDDRDWCSEPGCRVPEALLHADGDGVLWCNSHDPNPAMVEARRLGRQRGALSTAKHFRRGLREEDLGPLESPEDAKRWSSVIAKAAATGQITPAQANASTRAVHQFLHARDQHIKETELADLRADVARLKQQGRR